MNVIKISIIIFFVISTSLFSKQEYRTSDYYKSNNEISLGLLIANNRDTINKRAFEYSIYLAYSFILNDKFSITSSINPFFKKNQSQYHLLKMDRYLFRFALGGEYRFFRVRKHISSLLSGVKFFLDYKNKYFDEEYKSPDIEIEYEGKNSFTIDYAPYLGVEWKFLFLKSKRKHCSEYDRPDDSKNLVFGIKVNLMYEYLIRLRENRFVSNIALLFVF